MATKKASRSRRKPPAKKQARRKASKRRDPAGGKHGVRIRMYRLGVGDCFLLRFDRREGAPFTMLVDCGVHQSQPGGPDHIRKVVQNIADETNHRLDVLVVTHEHWDHLSGFDQAKDLFHGFEIGEVWTAWTENARDPIAKKLIDKRARAVRAVGLASEVVHATTGRSPHALDGLVGFLGDTTGTKLAAVGKVIKKLAGDGKNVRYRIPGEPAIELPGVNARVYILGPPRSPELIRRDKPRKSGDEVYSLDAFAIHLDAVESGLAATASPPFDRASAIPLAGTRGIDFFQRHYWADDSPDEPRHREETTQAWRRIDTAWLDAATHLALKLDEDTNNTSLVMAIELGDVGGPVLLFAADAQVGNWLSWQNVVWKDVDGKQVTGPDLLRRTVIYKVGHHASHNATLKKEGLEMMDALELALVPTDSKMAKTVKWGTLPWPKLLKRLSEKTNGRVVRTDRNLEDGVKGFRVEENRLFYEIQL